MTRHFNNQQTVSANCGFYIGSAQVKIQGSLSITKVISILGSFLRTK